MPLTVYNTLTRRKQDFIPLDPEGKTVNMYVCGVTVYSDSHIGHAMNMIVFDVIIRYLEFRGYRVNHVCNYTDIDDKMINRANEEGVTVAELAERFISSYEADARRLGVFKPGTQRPRATDYIPRMVEYIKTLVDAGYAYESDGDAYFSVGKFNGYGKLSGRNLDEMETSEDPKKASPHDFALWKAKKPGEPSWPSPWGEGRPGWHIECSVMSAEILGVPTIDIHGGGNDLIFPHHENEIAQAEAYNLARCGEARQFVRYWLHNGHVMVDKQKMSKSLGNFFTIKEVLAEYPADVVRMLVVGSHYRSPVDFSRERMDEARAALRRLANAVDNVLKKVPDLMENPEHKFDNAPHETLFKEAMDDDFNTPKALAVLFDLVSNINTELLGVSGGDNEAIGRCAKQARKLVELGNVLGFFRELKGEADEEPDGEYRELADKAVNLLKAIQARLGTGEEYDLAVDADEHKARFEAAMNLLIQVRARLRKEKNFALADAIRDGVAEFGFRFEDGKDGTVFKRD